MAPLNNDNDKVLFLKKVRKIKIITQDLYPIQEKVRL